MGRKQKMRPVGADFEDIIKSILSPKGTLKRDQQKPKEDLKVDDSKKKE